MCTYILAHMKPTSWKPLREKNLGSKNPQPPNYEILKTRKEVKKNMQKIMIKSLVCSVRVKVLFSLLVGFKRWWGALLEIIGWF